MASAEPEEGRLKAWGQRWWGGPSRSGRNATGTDRGWAQLSVRQHSRLWPQAPGAHTDLGGRQYGPDASLKFPACSLLPPQRPSPSFLHPSLALWAAQPGP